MNAVIGWHFTGPFLRDGRPLPKIGEWLVHDGPVAIGKSGLHACRHPFDALQYAPGPFLHKVECKDVVSGRGNKLVCRRRKRVATIDATDLLWRFARRRALAVSHLWDAPDVVREYLENGREDLRAAARAAALAAARAAYSLDGIVPAKNAAAWDAAWATAHAAGRATAWAAARGATWAAAASARASAAAIAHARDEFLAMVEEDFAEENV